MMRSFMTLCCLLPAILLGASEPEPEPVHFFWQAESGKLVTSYVTAVSTSSELTCVRECMTQTACDSFGYDDQAGLCYLEVVTVENTAPPPPYSVQVYTRQCRLKDAPVNLTTTNVSWTRSAWSVEGAVTCVPGYIYTGQDPAVRCSPSQPWSADGNCRQSVWNNPQVNQEYPVPRSPTPLWAACIQGVPTATDRFNVNLEGMGQTVLHVDFRMFFKRKSGTWQNNTLALDSKINSAWKTNFQKVQLVPFPVSEGQPFHLRVLVVDSTAVEVYVDGVLITSHTLPVAVQHISTFRAIGNVQLTWIDLWC